MLIALVALAAAQAAVADSSAAPPHWKLESCAMPNTSEVDTLRDVPADVRAELERLFKDGFADVGERFNSGDVIDAHDPVPQRRFLRAYHHAGDWAVWYEHGGLGHHLHVVGLRSDSRGKPAVDPFSQYGGFTSKTLCADSKAFFDGAETSFDR